MLDSRMALASLSPLGNGVEEEEREKEKRMTRKRNAVKTPLRLFITSHHIVKLRMKFSPRGFLSSSSSPKFLVHLLSPPTTAFSSSSRNWALIFCLPFFLVNLVVTVSQLLYSVVSCQKKTREGTEEKGEKKLPFLIARLDGQQHTEKREKKELFFQKRDNSIQHDRAKKSERRKFVTTFQNLVTKKVSRPISPRPLRSSRRKSGRKRKKGLLDI